MAPPAFTPEQLEAIEYQKTHPDVAPGASSRSLCLPVAPKPKLEPGLRRTIGRTSPGRMPPVSIPGPVLPGRQDRSPGCRVARRLAGAAHRYAAAGTAAATRGCEAEGRREGSQEAGQARPGPAREGLDESLRSPQ